MHFFKFSILLEKSGHQGTHIIVGQISATIDQIVIQAPKFAPFGLLIRKITLAAQKSKMAADDQQRPDDQQRQSRNILSV